jgi:putative oxidoreductase
MDVVNDSFDNKNKKSGYILVKVITALFVLLFAYTATSKFLDYNLFVFQMRLAPLPMMILVAPILGWLMPSIELIIAISLLFGRFRLNALYASVILLLIFEFYIVGMLLSRQHLPCTCGGIISTMSWKQHLIFNGVFIAIGLTAIVKLKNIKLIRLNLNRLKNHKDLSRA